MITRYFFQLFESIHVNVTEIFSYQLCGYKNKNNKLIYFIM